MSWRGEEGGSHRGRFRDGTREWWNSEWEYEFENSEFREIENSQTQLCGFVKFMNSQIRGV